VPTSRLEAFSDGVLAILITIMVLELRQPEGPRLADLGGHVAGGLLTYALSFVYIGIYWANHHHTFHLVERVDGALLWANNALLFVLSLLPFCTAWMDEQHFARTPTMVYGVNLLLAAVAYSFVLLAVYRVPGNGSDLREAMGANRKGKLSPVLYVTGILLCLVNPYLGLATYTVVAVIWLVPDRRVERYLAGRTVPGA
jgi:uncharacterized membrane protein